MLCDQVPNTAFSVNTFGIITWMLNEIWPTGGCVSGNESEGVCGVSMFVWCLRVCVCVCVCGSVRGLGLEFRVIITWMLNDIWPTGGCGCGSARVGVRVGMRE